MRKRAKPLGVRCLMLPLVLLFLSAVGQPARAQDELAVAKDSVRIKVTVRGCYYGQDCREGDNFLTPEIQFQVYGSMPSGSLLWAEFAPTGKKPQKYECSIDDVFGHENRWKAYCTVGVGAGGGSAFMYRGAVATGLIPFTLGVRNELMETNASLFTGKFKMAKYLINPKDPSTAQYYVDDDWRIPIGYLYFTKDRGLHVIMWFHGRPGGVKAYLFHQGKEIAKNEGCGVGDDSDFDPNRYDWWEVDCEIVGVYWDDPGAYDPHHVVAQNPGEYEIKALAGGKLARSVKFTVAEGGTIDNSIATANKVGTDRILLPVRVVGDQGPWNKLAWKTEAFYGNPLTGFTPPQ